MIVQGGFVPDGQVFESEVCVVGSGAAGLTLARSLASRGLDVMLVESGGLEFKPRTHALLATETSGRSDYPVGITRERFFGGTTNHWGGICRALDAFELEPHPWMPDSGWPIGRADLDPYYAAAAELLGLDEVDPVYDPAALGVDGLPRLVDAHDSGIVSVRWKRVRGERLRMGPWLQPEVKASRSLRCVVNTTIAEIRTDASGRTVEHLEGRTFSGRTLSFRARDYVIAAGGIENARLLLLSDSTVAGGLGNGHDRVGRSFMDHPGRGLGQILVTDERAPLHQEEAVVRDVGSAEDPPRMIGWTTSPALRARERLQGFMCFALWFDGVQEFERAIPHTGAILELTRPPPARTAGDAQPAPRFLHLAVNWEQSPNPDSRVTLSRERDALGIRKPHLHWEVTEADLQSARRSAELFSLAVARTGRARVHLDDIVSGRINNGGGHHMGTTRMADDPARGVTDRDGRVHGVENLFMAGSSLFPTSGWQHPTFTIVALALRQADLLEMRARSRRNAAPPASG